MKQILILAYKLLVNDKGKYTALLVGTTFSVFLIVQMTSSFAGILTKASATVINIGASVWVMDPAASKTVFGSIPMPDYVLDAVRSIDGVKYAVPLSVSAALLKLHDGTYQAVTVLGLDDNSLVGRPELTQGSIDDIFAENGFIAVKDEEFPKLGNPAHRHRVRTQPASRRHRRHRQGPDRNALRHADALHHLLPGAPVHPILRVHHLIYSGRT